MDQTPEQFDAAHSELDLAAGHITADAWQWCRNGGTEEENLAAFEAAWRRAGCSMVEAVRIGLCSVVHDPIRLPPRRKETRYPAE